MRPRLAEPRRAERRLPPLALSRLAARLRGGRRRRAYAVVWPAKQHRGRTISVVADLTRTSTLAAAKRRARARWLFALPAPEQRRAYLAAGFLPTPQKLHFMGKALAGRLNPDPSAWRFTLGDTDFF